MELQATKNEKETDELLEMKRRIERLEIEKSETRELREKFDHELELIEEQWRKEVSPIIDYLHFILSDHSQADNLMALVSKLEDENRRLRDDIQNKTQLNDKSELFNSPESISKKE